jgi:TonB family protein
MKVDRPSGDDHDDPILSQLATEYDEDARRLRWTVAIAAAFHAVLLMVTLPEIAWRPQEVPVGAKKLYVVEQVRFRPPAAKPQQAIPQKSAKKIPIPDPTPHEPEPLVVEDIQVPDIDLLEGLDVVFGIPEAPPGPGGLDGWGDALEVGGDVLAPVKVYAPHPRYTEEARKARLQGMVLLRAVIDDEGNIAAVAVMKELTLGLTESAVETVKTWKYEPATRNGVPVPVYMFISVNFRLT